MLYCSPDPILGVSEAFRASTAPQKLNLGVGACESPMPLNILRSAPAHSTYAYVSSIVLVLCVQAGTSQFGGFPLWLGSSSVSLHMQYLSVMSAHAPSQGSGMPAPAADPQRMPTRDSLIPIHAILCMQPHGPSCQMQPMPRACSFKQSLSLSTSCFPMPFITVRFYLFVRQPTDRASAVDAYVQVSVCTRAMCLHVMACMCVIVCGCRP